MERVFKCGGEFFTHTYAISELTGISVPRIYSMAKKLSSMIPSEFPDGLRTGVVDGRLTHIFSQREVDLFWKIYSELSSTDREILMQEFRAIEFRMSLDRALEQWDDGGHRSIDELVNLTGATHIDILSAMNQEPKIPVNFEIKGRKGVYCVANNCLPLVIERLGCFNRGTNYSKDQVVGGRV